LEIELESFVVIEEFQQVVAGWVERKLDAAIVVFGAATGKGFVEALHESETSGLVPE
jgi:hypothetical protein